MAERKSPASKSASLQQIKAAFKGQTFLLEKRLKRLATKADVRRMEKKQEGFERRQERMEKKQEGFERRQERMEKKQGKFLTKQDAKNFVTKDYLDERLENVTDEIVARVTNAVQADREKEIADFNEVHQDEIDIIAGEKNAPVQWKSIPRRVKTLEMEVESVKDRLEAG